MIRKVINKTRFEFRKRRNEYLRNKYGACAVLLYHRVTNLETDPQLLSVSPLNFEDHIQILRKNYRLLTTDEYYSHLANKIKFPENSVWITFDDGYADNLLEALPILEKYEADSMFYIATGTLNTSNEFWWDALERIILLSTNGDDVNIQAEGINFNPSKISINERQDIYSRLLPVLRRMSVKKREQLIQQFANAFYATNNRPSHRALTFDELRLLNNSSYVTIGAHTNMHPSLGALNYEEQLLEIQSSKSILEKELSCVIKHFSFPFGTISDYNKETTKICADLNFSSVAANFPALTHANTSAICFPRFLVRNWNKNDFQHHLQQFFRS
jgi:peptidoglycan/xylan/chitin deacetylase (PgdA/CDA1 family)